MKKIILIGYDPEIIEMIHSTNSYLIEGYIDPFEKDGDYFDLKYLGDDNTFIKKYSLIRDCELILTLDDTEKRKLLFNKYKNIGYSFAKVISPKANLSKFCSFGEGCIIQDLVNISYNVNLQFNIKINTAANIMHDVNINSHSTIAPNAVLLGYVKVGEMCFVGSHSTLLPRIVISNRTTVGAGSVVTKNLDGGTFVGVPAKRINK